MRMAQGLLNSVQKERDTLKEEIVGLKAKLESANESTDSAAAGRMVDVSVAYQRVAAELWSDSVSQLEQRYAALEVKYHTLEAEHQELRSKQELGLPSAASNQRNGSLEPVNGRKPRLSSGASDLEKQVIGFRQMIEDLQTENGELYQTIQDLEAQMKAADDDNKELASTNKQTQEVRGSMLCRLVLRILTQSLASNRNLTPCTRQLKVDLTRWRGRAKTVARRELVPLRVVRR